MFHKGAAVLLTHRAADLPKGLGRNPGQRPHWVLEFLLSSDPVGERVFDRRRRSSENVQMKEVVYM